MYTIAILDQVSNEVDVIEECLKLIGRGGVKLFKDTADVLLEKCDGQLYMARVIMKNKECDTESCIRKTVGIELCLQKTIKTIIEGKYYLKEDSLTDEQLKKLMVDALRMYLVVKSNENLTDKYYLENIIKKEKELRLDGKDYTHLYLGGE